MKKLILSTIAAAVVGLAPLAVWAQEHPGGEHASPRPGGMSHPMGGGHPASMGHPSMSYRGHVSTSHHTVFHRPAVHATTSRNPHATTNAHIDISQYHKNITAERQYHYGNYRAPAGYAYRRWSYGEHLPAIYYAQDYWIPNYWNFGLAWAPDGCEWVRFGPDAILVDIDTGEVIQVVYGVFY
ncbi:MAG: RcnB family protein [Rhizomicrobium sp.]|jgi:Ni/Co efflux regulator RcnB